MAILKDGNYQGGVFNTKGQQTIALGSNPTHSLFLLIKFLFTFYPFTVKFEVSFLQITFSWVIFF